MEQYIIACLDMGEINEADTNLAKLKAKFPRSNRVARLEGMSHEARGIHNNKMLFVIILSPDLSLSLTPAGKFEDAFKIYDVLMVDNPANVVVMKRLVGFNLVQL